MLEGTSHNIKVGIYARVSTEEQREGQTIDSQVAELERFASEKTWCVVDVYKDEGWSGSLLARPELDRLRDDASTGKFSLLLINDVDRLARDVSHLGIIKRDLERSGIEVIFKKLPAEKSPTYNLMVNILGSFAEFEREMIADRTRRGKRHKVEARQLFLGAKPAYGYRYFVKDRAAGRDGHLEIIPEEAAVVRQMYQWVDVEGLSARKVKDRLNEGTINPRSRRKWAKSTVVRILRSEIYAGVWYYNKHYSCEPAHPASQARYRLPKSSRRLRSRSEWLPVILPAHLSIVNREQWERVQRQLTSNIAFSSRNSKRLYLLKGLLRCGGCGATYVGDPCHGKFYYRCNRRCKKLPTIREELLDETVWNAIEEAVSNPSIILDQVMQLQKRSETNAKNIAGESDNIKRALKNLYAEESRVLEAYRTNIISPAQLGQELEKLQIRKKSLEMRQHHLMENGKNNSGQAIRRSVIDYCEHAKQRLKSLTGEERQHFLRLLIDTIIFEGHQVKIRGVIPVKSIPQNIDYATLPRDLQARFANTMIGNYGRNSVVETPVNFYLVRPILSRLDRNPVKQAA